MRELFEDTVFDTLIDDMPDIFDSHDLIFGMMRRYPRAYTLALYECRRSKDPIRTLHSKIGRKLSELTGRVRKVRRKASVNARGLHSTNQYWEKIGGRGGDRG